jgi:hypothetical protein
MFLSRKALCLALPAAVLLSAGPLAAQCTVTRSQIESALASGATGDQLYAQYGTCTSNDTPSSSTTSPSLDDESGIRVMTDEANTFVNFNINWERIESCGYHPQRAEADCAVEIRQPFGFAGAIGAGPGSFEWVLLCVNLGAGLVPLGTGQVHVHDAPGQVAPWDFGVVIQPNPQLSGRLKNGASFPARAILSWAVVPPANCNWAPVFGNWANFRLRLDP